MPGPQTQHKGTVYGDDENAPKSGTRPAGAPQTAARPPADLTQPSPPGHDSSARQTGATVCVRYAWGAVHVDRITEIDLAPSSSPSCPSSLTYLLTFSPGFREFSPQGCRKFLGCRKFACNIMHRCLTASGCTHAPFVLDAAWAPFGPEALQRARFAYPFLLQRGR